MCSPRRPSICFQVRPGPDCVAMVFKAVFPTAMFSCVSWTSLLLRCPKQYPVRYRSPRRSFSCFRLAVVDRIQGCCCNLEVVLTLRGHLHLQYETGILYQNFVGSESTCSHVLHFERSLLCVTWGILGLSRLVMHYQGCSDKRGQQAIAVTSEMRVKIGWRSSEAASEVFEGITCSL